MKTMVSLTAGNQEKVVKCDNDNGKAVNVHTFFHKWQLEPKVRIADHWTRTQGTGFTIGHVI
jgi:hypothetical protein